MEREPGRAALLEAAVGAGNELRARLRGKPPSPSCPLALSSRQRLTFPAQLAAKVWFYFDTP